MRKQFVETVSKLALEDNRIILLLGDIGVHGFSSLAREVPKRVLNIGILEQSMVGTAAGLASEGFIPIIHTIAPFVIERAYEQLKIDFGYQGLCGNIATVGASYDYSALGPTHHCPADVSLILNIPHARIFVPGSAKELDVAIRQNHQTGLNYFRLSEETHGWADLSTGMNCLLEVACSEEAVIFVGPTLRFFSPSLINRPLNVYYLNAVHDSLDLSLPDRVTSCYVVQDFYSGPLESILTRLSGALRLRVLSPKREFLDIYGDRQNAYARVGLSAVQVSNFLNNV